MSDKPHFSVVIPVYGCASCLRELCDRLKKTLTPLSEDFEILLVDDRSQDGGWNIIKQLASEDTRIKGLHFSRNFGQHYAISAGLDHARGNWLVVMDGDLQDRPEEIPRLYQKALEGYDIVYGISDFRSERFWLTTLFRSAYFRLYDLLANNSYATTNLSFYIMSSRVHQSLIRLRESSRHISSLLRYVGFSITGIEIRHDERKLGKSTYTFLKRFELAYTGIIAYSSRLLKLSFMIGLLFAFLSFLLGLYLIFNWMNRGVGLAGWTSLMVLISFSTGLILMSIGIIGMYLEKVFLEVKGRPLYIIEEVCNLPAPRDRIEGVL